MQHEIANKDCGHGTMEKIHAEKLGQRVGKSGFSQPSGSPETTVPILINNIILL